MNDFNQKHTEFETQHGEAALREGWVVSDTSGSENGPYQIQCVVCPEGHDSGFPIPLLDSDNDAWTVVLTGQEPHHKAALEFIKEANPLEYDSIMAFKAKLKEALK